MNNSINSQILELLSGIDSKKINQLNSLIKNMSNEDINNILKIINQKN